MKWHIVYFDSIKDLEVMADFLHKCIQNGKRMVLFHLGIFLGRLVLLDALNNATILMAV